MATPSPTTLSKSTLNNTKLHSEFLNASPPDSLQTEKSGLSTSLAENCQSLDNKSDLMGKLEIQLINGKEVRKKGSSLFSKDTFYVKMAILNTKNPKTVKSKENESGGYNPIWNDLLVLKVFEGDIQLTVEIWQKDVSVGTGVVLLEKYLEPEKSQSLWVDVERRNQHSGSVQMILTFKPQEDQSLNMRPSASSHIDKISPIENLNIVPSPNLSPDSFKNSELSPSAPPKQSLPGPSTYQSLPTKINLPSENYSVSENSATVPALPPPSFPRQPYNPYPNGNPTSHSSNSNQSQEYVPYPNETYSPYGSLSRNPSNGTASNYNQPPANLHCPVSAANQSYSPSIVNQSYSPSVVNQSYYLPAVNQPYSPSAVNYIPPFVNQSYSPPVPYYSNPSSQQSAPAPNHWNQSNYPGAINPGLNQARPAPHQLSSQPPNSGLSIYAPPDQPPPGHFPPSYTSYPQMGSLVPQVPAAAVQYGQVSPSQRHGNSPSGSNHNFPNQQYYGGHNQ